ncbi:hypothetical protein V1477_014935 [Vespula maculifrons]|uniref:Uncharacterized protein n=1 Tax=Vespula maculifrons TaxID=7453 RepID=A0ABD2BIW1_VESMC
MPLNQLYLSGNKYVNTYIIDDICRLVEIKDRNTNVTLERVNFDTSVFTSINLYHKAARLITITAPPAMVGSNTEGLGSLCKFVPSGGSFNVSWRGHTERNLFSLSYSTIRIFVYI